MTTARLTSKTGLTLAALYLAIGVVALYVPGWLLVKLGPDSPSIPTLVWVSVGVASLVPAGLVLAAVRKGR